MKAYITKHPWNARHVGENNLVETVKHDILAGCHQPEKFILQTIRTETLTRGSFSPPESLSQHRVAGGTDL